MEVITNKYLKRTLVVASVMIIIFSIIMLWPLPLRKVLRQETDTAMTVSLSDNDTNISSFSLSGSSVEYRRIMEILEDHPTIVPGTVSSLMNLLPVMVKI